jgi:nucleoside 2-deoxyribosyltransferase
MPFAFPDTDRLFEEVICAVLKTLDIEPVRVDRIEHNDDIDERIIREIKTADFAIADLTYARPSVYYEAGFAERAIPVIYTSRRDHLAPRADDAMGNHRLHFDLQMKNVIDWADPDDAVFSSRLAGQVRSVISPLLRDAEADSRERAEKAAFQSLSVDSRIQVLSKSAERILAELDFTAASAAKTKFGQQFIRWQPQIEICDVYFVC